MKAVIVLALVGAMFAGDGDLIPGSTEKTYAWRAWVDGIEGPLHVTGTYEARTSGYKVSLVPDIQGINPSEYMLKLVVQKPSGTVMDVITPIPVVYEESKPKTQYLSYRVQYEGKAIASGLVEDTWRATADEMKHWLRITGTVPVPHEGYKAELAPSAFQGMNAKDYLFDLTLTEVKKIEGSTGSRVAVAFKLPNYKGEHDTVTIRSNGKNLAIIEIQRLEKATPAP